MTPSDLWATDQIYSISFLTERIKNLLSTHIPMLWIFGEISNLRQQSSGHFYFTLKDEHSQIACVLFRGDALHLSFPLENGKSILCYGSLDIYAPRGHYQWIARHMLPHGMGQFEAEFQRLKEKCQREGLFDPKRKYPIPQAARHIAILSSPTGAALQDFLQILRRKDWRGDITLFPCRVQGNDSIQDFLHGLDQVEHSSADLIVLARGGGSIEDLWTFNSEALVRKIAHCQKPVISAIGHETDFTLVDFVADLRAETPSGAAEIIASFYQSTLQQWQRLQQRIDSLLQHWQLRHRHSLQLLKQRLEQASPSRYREKWQYDFQRLSFQLHEKALFLLQQKQSFLADLQKRFEHFNLARNLRSGFLIAQSLSGEIIKNRQAIPPGTEFILHLCDGSIRALSIMQFDEKAKPC
jgi:exodeoxyribonuclease VII large subunit